MSPEVGLYLTCEDMRQDGDWKCFSLADRTCLNFVGVSLALSILLNYFIIIILILFICLILVVCVV